MNPLTPPGVEHAILLAGRIPQQEQVRIRHPADWQIGRAAVTLVVNYKKTSLAVAPNTGVVSPVTSVNRPPNSGLLKLSVLLAAET
jgi:hypothetical protein